MNGAVTTMDRRQDEQTAASPIVARVCPRCGGRLTASTQCVEGRGYVITYRCVQMSRPGGTCRYETMI